MGKPDRGNARSRLNESNSSVGGTRGSETSKYPEEKKENSIALVVASEEARGQTEGLRTLGVEGRRHTKIVDLNCLERQTEDGDSPVREGEDS